MIGPVYAPQIIPVHAGVELGRPQVGMAQQFADTRPGHARFRHLAREAVPQPMGADWHTSPLTILAQLPFNAADAQWFASEVLECKNEEIWKDQA